MNRLLQKIKTLRTPVRLLKDYKYIYQAKIVRWVDGDTVEMIVDLGFQLNYGSQEKPITFRLYGINTPEKNTVAGLEAAKYVVGLAPPGTDVIIQTFKSKLKDNFGRYLAIIYIGEVSFIMVQEPNINQILVTHGLAEVYLK